MSRTIARSAAVVLSVAIVALAPAAARAAKHRPVGRVFLPNPVVALGDQTLTDDRDADSPAFAEAYVDVRLRNLDHSGYLRGRFVSVCGSGCAFSAKERFRYDRSDPRFEQVMAYWAVNKAQRYLRNLGFTDVNEDQQEVVIRSGIDNSFYDPKKDVLQFGMGGVDDAEDMDVIWHEHGHAILDDQVPGFGSGGDALAIGEGFGDYWAYTMSEPFTPVDPACIADWDSTSYSDDVPHCLRRVDLDLTVEDMTGSPHHDGQLWSRALADIRSALGATDADRAIVQAQFAFAPDTSFADAADVVVETARELFGNAAANAARDAFAARGIL